MSTWIKHYNHNHDPRNGQFTYSGSSVMVAKKQVRHLIINKPIKTRSKQLQTTASDNKVNSDTAKKVAIILGITAGVSLAALGGYMLYKNGGYNVLRSVIPKGTTLQNLSELKNRPELKDAFYASYKPRDNRAYIRNFSTDYKANMNAGSKATELIRKYKNLSEVTDDMKVGSVHDAKKAFKKVMNNDPNKIKDLLNIYEDGHYISQKDRNKAIQALNKLANGKHISNSELDSAYRMFNRNIVDRRMDEIAKPFYNELKSKGLSAIMDIEDFSDTHFAEAPVIIFDHSKLILKSSERLTMDEFKAAKRIKDAAERSKEILKEIRNVELATLIATIPVTSTIVNVKVDNKRSNKK